MIFDRIYNIFKCHDSKRRQYAFNQTVTTRDIQYMIIELSDLLGKDKMKMALAELQFSILTTNKLICIPRWMINDKILKYEKCKIYYVFLSSIQAYNNWENDYYDKKFRYGIPIKDKFNKWLETTDEKPESWYPNS